MLLKKYATPIKNTLIILGVWLISILHYTLQVAHTTTITGTFTYKDTTAPKGYLYGITTNNYAINLTEKLGYVKQLCIAADTTNLTNLIINTGGGLSQVIPKSNLVLITTKPININPLLVSNLSYYSIKGYKPLYKISLPILSSYINWGGAFNLMFISIFNLFNLTILSVVFIAIYISSKIKISNTLTFNFGGFNKHTHYIQSLVFCFLVFIILLKCPYYFLYWDNYIQFQPIINSSLQQWYATGIVPTYNAYQYAGMPTSGISMYALYYPFTHISYLVSTYILHNSYYTTTVFVIIHLGIGYGFMCVLLRRVGVNSIVATTAALGYIFSGIAIHYVSSMYYMAPTVAFVPVIAYYTYKLVTTNLYNKYFMHFTIVFTLYAYGGNVQMFVYSFSTFAVFLLLYSLPYNKFGRRIWLTLVYISLLAMSVTLLFLPQLLVSISVLHTGFRTADSSDNTYHNFTGLVYPLYLQLVNTYSAYTITHFKNIVAYNSNAVFSLLAFVMIAVMLINKKIKDLMPRAFLVLLIIFIILILLSLGKGGVVWILLSKLPVYNLFRYPIKALLIVQFLSMFIGCIAFQYILNNVVLKHKKILQALVILCTVASLVYTITYNNNYYVNHPYKPYSTHPIVDKLCRSNQYRVLSLANYNSFYNSTALAHNFGVVAGVPTLNMLDEQVINKPNLIPYSKQYAVRYYIHHTLSNIPEQELDDNTATVKKEIDSIKKICKQTFSDSEITVYEDTAWQKIITIDDALNKSLQNYTLTYLNNGVKATFTTPVTCTKLTASFIARSKLTIYLDGKKYIPQTDSFGRLYIYPKQTFSEAYIKYEPYSITN